MSSWQFLALMAMLYATWLPTCAEASKSIQRKLQSLDKLGKKHTAPDAMCGHQSQGAAASVQSQSTLSN
eukprot:CAMPEP_0204519176 /NCGR_PEP_ID=MMETSP0661-20131031/4597_1 /ASSEMBLY_ACC=CAM_ASM_000606 /TAXON_ID=109239 /ORGANISM="Alexandrium margalefi, Strain AMGDE01CS-322" /LENGTH=68 /DNA_ID=CAMNT_0051524667 /DNA_START=44 /DNA_END=250 /DNA_ORIENTATION=+